MQLIQHVLILWPGGHEFDLICRTSRVPFTSSSFYPSRIMCLLVYEKKWQEKKTNKQELGKLQQSCKRVWTQNTSDFAVGMAVEISGISVSASDIRSRHPHHIIIYCLRLLGPRIMEAFTVSKLNCNKIKIQRECWSSHLQEGRKHMFIKRFSYWNEGKMGKVTMNTTVKNVTRCGGARGMGAGIGYLSIDTYDLTLRELNSCGMCHGFGENPQNFVGKDYYSYGRSQKLWSKHKHS